MTEWRRSHLAEYQAAEREAERKAAALAGTPAQPQTTTTPDHPITRDELTRAMSQIVRDARTQARDRVNAGLLLVRLCGWQPDPEPPTATTRVAGHDVPVATVAGLADAMREIARLRSASDAPKTPDVGLVNQTPIDNDATQLDKS